MKWYNIQRQHTECPHRMGRNIFISHRPLAREGDYEMMPVCACMRALLCHAHFSKTTTATDFCKLIVPMNFHALEKNFGFMDLSLKISE